MAQESKSRRAGDLPRSPGPITPGGQLCLRHAAGYQNFNFLNFVEGNSGILLFVLFFWIIFWTK